MRSSTGRWGGWKVVVWEEEETKHLRQQEGHMCLYHSHELPYNMWHWWWSCVVKGQVSRVRETWAWLLKNVVHWGNGKCSQVAEHLPQKMFMEAEGQCRRLNGGQIIISLICDSYPHSPPRQVLPGNWAWCRVLAVRAAWGTAVRYGVKREGSTECSQDVNAGPGPELQREEVHPSKGQAVRQDQTCLGTVKGNGRAGKGGQQVGADVLRAWFLLEGASDPAWG